MVDVTEADLQRHVDDLRLHEVDDLHRRMLDDRALVTDVGAHRLMLDDRGMIEAHHRDDVITSHSHKHIDLSQTEKLEQRD